MKNNNDRKGVNVLEVKQVEKGEQKAIVDEIIKAAAEEANITTEQSRTNLLTALKHIQMKTLQTGGMDLSSIGTEVYTRSWLNKS